MEHPYTCEDCGANYVHQPSLSRHRARKHAPPPEEPPEEPPEIEAEITETIEEPDFDEVPPDLPPILRPAPSAPAPTPTPPKEPLFDRLLPKPRKGGRGKGASRARETDEAAAKGLRNIMQSVVDGKKLETEADVREAMWVLWEESAADLIAKYGNPLSPEVVFLASTAVLVGPKMIEAGKALKGKIGKKALTPAVPAATQAAPEPVFQPMTLSPDDPPVPGICGICGKNSLNLYDHYVGTHGTGA